MEKEVFITYSWDSEEHKTWVRNLANSLIKNGINVRLDQYDVNYGDSTAQFMQNAVVETDNTIVVLTPNYRKKSLKGSGGVGYEQQIISGEILAGVGRKKFIPIIKSGNYTDGEDCAIPPHFMGISTIDFRDDSKFNTSLEDLLRTLLQIPKFKKPELGEKPNFEIIGQEDILKIYLNKDFNFVQSEITVTDILLKIADYRKSNLNYSLTFDIEGISDFYTKYEELNSLRNPSEGDIQEKLVLRESLNTIFYKDNGTIYEYLTYSLNTIIDNFYLKHFYINSFSDLYKSINECFSFFSKNGLYKHQGKIPFDMYIDKKGWAFKIDVQDEEVQKLSSKFGINDRILLTRLGGLDTFDLSENTILESVIPKQTYEFTIRHFQKKLTENDKDEFFKLSNWSIGLA